MTLRYTGPLSAMPPDARAALLDRRASFEPFLDAVRPIRDAVRARGDDALRELTERFDGVKLSAIDVPREERRFALARLAPDVVEALAEARRNLERFHRAQLRAPEEVEVVPGLVAGRRHLPIHRVGAYVPGGRAAYPSTVLMTAVPARVAGVREIVVATPPARDGNVPDATLAACEIAGVDRVLAVGGAQAVFALAYGTESVPRVDKIVGPGNAYVAAAKALVAGEVAIDAPAGPSEVLVCHVGSHVAEEARDARLAALEVVAQAEHDPEAACAVVTTSATFAAAVAREIAREAAATPRRSIVEAALAKRGAVVHARGEEEALAFSDAYAPEHLVVLARDPRSTLDRLSHYGSAFLGPWSSVALGDYVSGPNHVLPTAGLARSYAGLSVDDFLRRATHQTAAPQALKALAAFTERLATLEGLPAHARAVTERARVLEEQERST